MKKCIKCGSLLNDDVMQCPSCNANQVSFFDEFEPQPAHNSTFLKILCSLTIAGALLSLASTVFTAAAGKALPVAGLEVVTYVGVAVAIGKLTGAVFMLLKKLTGLYIYTVAAILAIVLQVYSVYLTSEYMESLAGGSGAFVIIGTAFALLFYLAFLVMYWLPVNRRLLS